MMVVEAITLVAVLAVIVAGAFWLFRPPTRDVPSRIETQRDEAHQILLEVQINDELLVFLPSKLRDKINDYMAKYSGGGR
jgi:hypothetical protein